MVLLLNKELYKSIKSNKLIINITNEEYNKINLLIGKLKIKYNKEIKNINDNKKNFDKIKEHNLLVKDIIKEVIENFEIIKKYDVCIFLTGSYARYTNKLNSDLDFHFCYKNKYRNILFKYEEIIYYILLSIFDLNRGKVHNMILSRINKFNTIKINSKIDKKDLEILLISDNTQKIKYILEGNIKNRLYLQYCNKKDIKSIYKYLRKEILNLNREWAHVFYIFTNKIEFLNYYNKLLKIEKKKLNIKKIIKRKDKIIKQIEFINQKINKITKYNMCDFKTIFQMEEFKLLYEYISYKRDLYLLNNGNWQFINFLEYENYFKNDNTFKSIENYMYNLFKIVEPLKNKYSIHKKTNINTKYFNSLEKDLFKINKLIGDELWNE